MPHGSDKSPEKTLMKFAIRCVCHTEAINRGEF